MARRATRYRWELALRSSPAALWPLVADTNRFDRDAGTPAVARLVERDAELTNARTAVRQRIFGVTLRYEQEPFEWVYPEHFAVTRHYETGPLAELAVRCRLEPAADGGTDCRYEVDATPRNLLGRLAIPLQIGVIYRRTFTRTFRRYDQLAGVGEGWVATGRPPQHPAGAVARLAEGTEQLESAPGVEQLRRLLEHGDDVAVTRIRPYQMADLWGLPRRPVLDLFLRATRAGLLGFRWDVLCPRCGVAKASVAHLQDLPGDVHCSTCNIDYRANFERSVELCFRAAPSIRSLVTDEYCIGAPMATPQVVSQLLVGPHDTVVMEPALGAGRHRIRCYELPGARSLLAAGDGPTGLDVTISPAGWPDDEATVGLRPVLQVRNDTDDEQLVLVERTSWHDQAVTAAEVTALQEFRDLFASEALRPGERIEVGSLTVVFTDLRASTELYQRIGDAVAFGYVLAHFDALRAAVAEADGAIVKTIGDAVMAVFPRPVEAVTALLAAQEAVADIVADGEPLALKAGVHHGPCIAVTLNGQLDYFGTTVNLAARLEGLAERAQLVVSDTVRHDPEVAALLGRERGVRCAPVNARLKGFVEPVTAHRLERPPRRPPGGHPSATPA